MNFTEFIKKFQHKEVIVVPNKVQNTPLVTISVLTYQHVNFIRDCLDNILTQQTNFHYEILLGDDFSTDGTREICIEYAKKYPDKIRLFLHHRENNININNTPTGRFNFVYNYFVAKGKYIALCEGDDYWIDPLKLQKQVDFLEQNEEYGICFHNVKIFNQAEKKIMADSITREVPETTDINELAKGNFIHTPSVLVKNNFELPKWFTAVSMGDWTLYMLQIKNQKIKKLNDEMAVYRIHPGGVWGIKSPERRNQLTELTIKLIYQNANLDSSIKEILRSRIETNKKTSLLDLLLKKLFKNKY